MKCSHTIKYRVLYKRFTHWHTPQSNTFLILDNAIKFAEKHPWAQIWKIETDIQADLIGETKL